MSAPPVLPPRPGGRTRPVPAIPPVTQDEIYDDCEDGGVPADPDDVYDDFDEGGAPPLPPHPGECYDDIGNTNPAPPPPPQRPKPAIPLMTPPPPQEEYDDCGPIVHTISKRPQPPLPVTQFTPPHSSQQAPDPENVYELGDDVGSESNSSLPPPPMHDDGPIYEVEPDVDDSDRPPPPPPPPFKHPSHPPPPPNPSSGTSDVPPPPPSRPAAHQAAKSQGVKSPKAAPPGGFSMDLGLLQGVKAGLRRVPHDSDATSTEASPSHDSKMYGSPPETVYDAKKIFENKIGGKPGPFKQSSTEKVNSSLSSIPKPQQAVAPVSRMEPQNPEFDDPDDIYDDASSTVIDPLMRHDWYHGSISRPEGDKRVKAVGKDGAFLVRVSEKDPKFPYTLVVLHKGSINNLRIRQREDTKVALGDEKAGELAFKDVPAMIEHHRQNNVVLLGSNQSNVKLQHSASKN